MSLVVREAPCDFVFSFFSHTAPQPSLTADDLLSYSTEQRDRTTHKPLPPFLSPELHNSHLHPSQWASSSRQVLSLHNYSDATHPHHLEGFAPSLKPSFSGVINPKGRSHQHIYMLWRLLLKANTQVSVDLTLLPAASTLTASFHSQVYLKTWPHSIPTCHSSLWSDSPACFPTSDFTFCLLERRALSTLPKIGLSLLVSSSNRCWILSHRILLYIVCQCVFLC